MKLLRGGGREMIAHYRELMTEAAEKMDFEAAQEYKVKMQAL